MKATTARPTADRILFWLEDGRSTSAGSIAFALDLSPSTVCRWLNRLKAEGAVEVAREKECGGLGFGGAPALWRRA